MPAIDRYDGPLFRVLRKYAVTASEGAPYASVLSARFGLIPGDYLIPRYERRIHQIDTQEFSARVGDQLNRLFDQINPRRVFVSVGSEYWPYLGEGLERKAEYSELRIATGGIGGRASQLARWLHGEDFQSANAQERRDEGAYLLGTTIRLSREEVLRKARSAMEKQPHAAERFETWHVWVGKNRVGAKWLVSVLFSKPVSRFRTADARRVLRLLGVDVNYAH